MTTRRRLLLGLAAAVGAPAAAEARIRWREPPTAPDRSPQFVQRTTGALVADLERRGATAALVFRAGLLRGYMPPETAYTHGSLWLRRTAAPRVAPGDDPADPLDAYVVYGLFTGDGVDAPSSRSVLRIERPADFMRRAIEDDVGVVIPTAALQGRLAAVVASPTYEALRLPRYSVFANPFRRQFQNCDVFLLYVVGAAAWDTDDPDEIRARLSKRFEPTLIRTPGLLTLLAPLVDGRISMADQRRRPVRTATYESIARFMVAQGMAEDAYVFRPPAAG